MTEIVFQYGDDPDRDTFSIWSDFLPQPGDQIDYEWLTRSERRDRSFVVVDQVHIWNTVENLGAADPDRQRGRVRRVTVLVREVTQ